MQGKLVATIAAVIAGLAAAPAQAAVPERHYLGCLDEGGAACAQEPSPVFQEPRDVVVSPDGKHAYVLGLAGLAAYARDPADQSLERVACYGSGACTAPPAAGALTQGRALAIAPDGGRLYVAGDNGLAAFVRDPAAGTLTFAGCTADDASMGCTAAPRADVCCLDGVAVGPDGATVYATSALARKLVSFTAAGPALVQTQTFAGVPDAVAVTPDGGSVLVAAAEQLIAFTPGSAGAFAFDRCAGPLGSGCATTLDRPAGHRAGGLAVSPGSDRVYVAHRATSGEPGWVDVIARDPGDRSLPGASCVAAAAIGPCTDLGTPALRDPMDVALAAGVLDVLAPGALVALEPSGTTLAAPRCVAALDGCGFLPAGRLDGPAGQVASSADGTSTYAVVGAAETLARLSTLAPPRCTTTTATVRRGETTSVALACASPDGRPVTGVRIVTGPARGTAVVDGLTLRYTPDGSGDDELTYAASNDLGEGPPVRLALALADGDAPDTEITGGPDDNALLDADKGAPAYDFRSTEPGSTFRCSTSRARIGSTGIVDRSPVRECAPGAKAEPLGEGRNVFEVAAVDAEGNVDPTPARRAFRWTVRRPDTQIVFSPPDGATSSRGPIYQFTSDTSFATFECKLDKDGAFARPFGPCRGKVFDTDPLVDGPGRYRFAVRAVDPKGRFDDTPAATSFVIVPGAPDGNVRVRGIDVFQVVQPVADATRFRIEAPTGFFAILDGGKRFAGAGVPSGFTDAGGVGERNTALAADAQRIAYRGVELDRDKPTTAVVYIDREAVPDGSGVRFDVRLVARQGRGVLWERTVTGRPLGTSTTPYVTADERVDPRMGVQFRLPQLSLFGGRPFELEATVAYTPGTTRFDTRQCDGRDCTPDDRFRLTGIPTSAELGAPILRPIELRVGATLPPPPEPTLARARQVLPGGERLAMAGRYIGTVDVTAASALKGYASPECGPESPPAPNAVDPALATRNCVIRHVIGRLEEYAARNEPRKEVAGSSIREYEVLFAVGRTPAGAYFHGPRLDATGVTVPGVSQIVVPPGERPLSNVAHELGHYLTAPHADRLCGGPDGGGAELWPPDFRGRLQGTKFDATKTPGVAKTPGVDGTGDLFDLMSYCAGTGDTDSDDSASWISPYNWERFRRVLVGFGQRVPRFTTVFRNGRALRQADPPLRVTAGVGPGGGRLGRVVPSAGPAPAAPPGSPVRVRSLAADGRVLLDAPARVSAPADAPGALTALAAVAGDAAAIELVRDGEVLDRRERTRAPVVEVLAPGPAERARPGRPVPVRWRAADPDGAGVREAVVELSDDDGRSWQAVWSGPDEGRASIPGDRFRASRRTRVRVVVNDGFAEGRDVSPRFAAAGAPPQPRVLGPSRTDAPRAGERTVLSGAATEADGRPVPGHRLTWFDGRRRLGTGERVRVRLAAGTRRLRLVARGADGRAGEARLVLRVRPAPLRLTKLTAPATVRRGVRTVTVRVAASAPATLRVGGRRVRIGTRTTSVRLALPRRPATGVLRLPFTAAPRGAGSTGTARGAIEVRRG